MDFIMDILSNYQVNTIRQVWILLIYYPILSYSYYKNSKSIFQSAHGIVALIGFIYAVVACEFTERDPADFWYWPIYICFFLSLGSILFSLKAFKGNKSVHFVHVITIIVNIMTSVVALMAVAHDWI